MCHQAGSAQDVNSQHRHTFTSLLAFFGLPAAMAERIAGCLADTRYIANGVQDELKARLVSEMVKKHRPTNEVKEPGVPPLSQHFGQRNVNVPHQRAFTSLLFLYDLPEGVADQVGTCLGYVENNAQDTLVADLTAEVVKKATAST